MEGGENVATEEERKNVIGIFFSHSANIALLSMADSNAREEFINSLLDVYEYGKQVGKEGRKELKHGEDTTK